MFPLCLKEIEKGVIQIRTLSFTCFLHGDLETNKRWWKSITFLKFVMMKYQPYSKFMVNTFR